jgi:5-methyltetrahydropteroyltriglutamate--homocysteine methyltransferase
MRRSTDRILTTHAGSLVRTHEIMESVRHEAFGEPIDESAFAEHLAAGVRQVVARQAENGVDIPSDGEFGKLGWNNYLAQRLDGLTPVETVYGRGLGARGKDRTDFADFYARWTRIERSMWLPEDLQTDPERATRGLSYEITGPIRYKGTTAIRRDIDNFKAALAVADVDEGFLPVVAPGSAEPGLVNKHYPDEESKVYALADALKQEYRAIIDAGLLLQVDDAFMPTLYDWMLPDITMADYVKFSELRIEALNYALEGIPEDRIRYHICWGSWNGPHASDVPLKDILHLLLKVNAGAYSIEAANPRHEHEWMVWRDTKLPEGKVLIPGVATHSTNVVEHPELVAWRIANFASLVGRENVIAGTDCGFAQHWNLIRTHESIQWAKLRSLAEGAALASKQLWG